MTIGNITIHTIGSKREFRLFGSQSLIGGSPSWNVIERAKRPPVTSWNGRELYSIELPLILDGWSARTPVGNALSWLRGLLVAANDAGIAQARPVTISGVGIMEIPRKDVRDMEFVVVSLEVDADGIIRRDDGELLRCSVSLVLQEYIEPPSITVKSSLTKAAASKRVIPMMVRKTDTYVSISNRFPKKYRARAKTFFMTNAKTRGGVKKLRAQAGKIFSVPV